MIVNIRGLSGSGKSTSVRKIMDLYPEKQVLLKTNRRALVTLCKRENFTDLIVIGPYDSDVKTTGCDVIPYNDQVKLLVRYFHDLGFNVLFEGMILSISNMLLELANESISSKALLLDVPEDVVKTQRKNRAVQRGNTKELKDAIVTYDMLMK